MSEILIWVSTLLTLPLAIWIGRYYFDGDIGGCIGAALTPWPVSLLMGCFVEHVGKAFKLEIFLIGVFLSGYMIFILLCAIGYWIGTTVIPFLK